jgi:glutamate/tyrosine decarboxylase-like PLP-dependent enzyme
MSEDPTSAAVWRLALGDNPHLSCRFRDRYASILTAASERCPDDQLDLARRLVAHDPDAAVRLLHGLAVDGPPEPSPASQADAVFGGGPTAALLRRLVDAGVDLDHWIDAQPPLLQTAVPLHPSRSARLVRTNDGAVLAAVRWSADSIPARERNAEKVAGITGGMRVSDGFRIVVHTDYAVVPSAGADPWVVAPNLGTTVEDLLRTRALGPELRGKLVATLTSFRQAMLEAAVVWQGFAPRNMFLVDGALVLIDFEEVVDVRDDPARAAECLLWHRIFFADCLTAGEAKVVFGAGQEAVAAVPDDHLLRADAFERALLGADTVTWAVRRELLDRSRLLEGRHRRRSDERDGGVLHGHELGHFWGDFVPVEVEARLFRVLSTIGEPTELVDVLEVFEAAMEADVRSMLRAAALGAGDVAPTRTTALVDLVERDRGEGLAAERRRHGDWYRRLRDDPSALVDGLIHARAALVGSVDAGAVLVGRPADRPDHERSVGRALTIGMDFLHRADRGESYLAFSNAQELLARTASSLPVEGASLDDVLQDLDEVVAGSSISQAHPGYLAFPDTGNAVAALAASVTAPFLNQNLIAVDRSAPIATFVEVQVVEWLRELVGYEAAPMTSLRGVKDVAGLWVTGGHLANHVAMLTALGATFPEARRSGLRSLDVQPTVVMAGPISHYSHSDAAFHLGLGWDAVLPVAARVDYTTDPAAVDALLSDPPDGRTPFMVVGVAGNCRTTGLDDLVALGDVCRRHGVWFHVDACHGGSLIFSDRLRQRHLTGVQTADSVSLDPHKGLFTPYPSSYVVFRDRGVLNQFSRHDKTVQKDGCWDLGLITPFLGSRGFHSLATWMLIRHAGTRALGALVERRQAHVRYLERRLDDVGLFVRLNDVDFYRFAFVLCPPACRSAIGSMPAGDRGRAAAVVSHYTSLLNTQLYEAGEVCFDGHTLADLDDRVGTGAGTVLTIMAACPGNPLVSTDELDKAVERLVDRARPLATAMADDLRGSLTPLRPAMAGPAGWADVP